MSGHRRGEEADALAALSRALREGTLETREKLKTSKASRQRQQHGATLELALVGWPLLCALFGT